jgi:hypothetical protein
MFSKLFFKKSFLACLAILFIFSLILLPCLVQAETVDECNRKIDEGKEYEEILRCCRQAKGKLVKVKEGDEEKLQCQLVGCCAFMDEEGGCAEDVTKEECREKVGLAGEPLNFSEQCQEGAACWIAGKQNCLEGSQAEYCALKQRPVKLQISIGGTSEVLGLPDYIMKIYVWAIRAIGALAVVVIMIAGFMWLTAAGNERTISDARARINAAITGLILASFSYTFLYIINPDLVRLKMPGIVSPRKVQQIETESADFCVFPKNYTTCNLDGESKGVWKMDGEFIMEVKYTKDQWETRVKREEENGGDEENLKKHLYVKFSGKAIPDKPSCCEAAEEEKFGIDLPHFNEWAEEEEAGYVIFTYNSDDEKQIKEIRECVSGCGDKPGHPPCKISVEAVIRGYYDKRLKKNPIEWTRRLTKEVSVW